jgi:hypothetical protein
MGDDEGAKAKADEVFERAHCLEVPDFLGQIFSLLLNAVLDD